MNDDLISVSERDVGVSPFIRLHFVMLRRVARVLRIGLFFLGVALVLWFPVSLFYTVVYYVGSQSERWILRSGGGAMVLTIGTYRDEGLEAVAAGPYILRDPRGVDSFRPQAVWPAFHHQRWPDYDEVFLSIPILIVAFVCLAWPVTSFIISRRRHKRGFPVEPSGAPLPLGEVPSKVAPGDRDEAERASVQPR